VLDGDSLYLFRDRFGKKPLFYLKQPKYFAFASEIKALKPLLNSIKMNEDAMLSYLSFLAPTPPHTFYKGIEKLESGSYLHYHNNTLTCKSYYNPLHVRANQIQNESQALRAIDEKLQEAITLRLESDVDMASLLSGGIDSALIASIAKISGKKVPTFTLGYSEYAKYDERQNAKESAEILGISNTEIIITQDKFIDASKKVFDALDEPLNDPAAIPLYLLFEAIKKEGYKTVLSGEGSDELFLGYRQYFEYLDIQKASTLTHKNWLKKYFHSNFSMNREWEWYKRIFDDSLLFRTSGEKFTDLQKNALLRRNVRDNKSLKYLAPYRESFLKSEHKDESIWYSFIDLKLFQSEHFLTKLDRVSMAHSIESRTPFLDHQLVETVFGIRPALRYQNAITKDILKKVAQPYLGEKILKRKKKGFANPYMEYLISSGKIETILHVNTKTGLFKKEALDDYIQRAKAGKFKQHVWGLYVLSCWIEKELL
jgi:asparagine synthase (glutamine-hydrolysing)